MVHFGSNIKLIDLNIIFFLEQESRKKPNFERLFNTLFDAV
jgi:hypothetical protein